jgi:hypothetical protein
MNFQTIAAPIGVLLLLGWAYQSMSWMGVAMAMGGLVMWALLHYTRLVHIFKKAAQRPIGFVASAVMLHVKLKPKMPLLKVIALTRSLGLAEKVEPKSGLSEKVIEIFSWADESGSSVRCVFEGGRLKEWTLTRTNPDDQQALAES